MLTGRDSTHDLVHWLNAGAEEYLTEPFDYDALVARVTVLTPRAAGSECQFHEGVLLSAPEGPAAELIRDPQLWTSGGQSVVWRRNLGFDLELLPGALGQSRPGRLGQAQWRGRAIRNPLALVGMAHLVHVLQVAARRHPCVRRWSVSRGAGRAARFGWSSSPLLQRASPFPTTGRVSQVPIGSCGSFGDAARQTGEGTGPGLAIAKGRRRSARWPVGVPW